MKYTDEQKARAKVARLNEEKLLMQNQINDLNKENVAIYDLLKDMTKLSANETDKQCNRLICNNTEIESLHLKIRKITDRTYTLLKLIQ